MTLGSTRFAGDGALLEHELRAAPQQKCERRACERERVEKRVKKQRPAAECKRNTERALRASVLGLALAVTRPLSAIRVRVLATERLMQQLRPWAHSAARLATQQHLALIAIAFATCSPFRALVIVVVLTTTRASQQAWQCTCF